MASKETIEYFISKYQDKYCYDLLDWCTQGRSIESFAAKINVIPDIFPIWMRQHQQFEICVHVAYWKSYAFWEDMALEDARTPVRHKTMNGTIYALVMRQRFKWVDTRQELLEEIQDMGNEELEARARLILDTKKDDKKVVVLDPKEEDDD
jgi:hypothetical protein